MSDDRAMGERPYNPRGYQQSQQEAALKQVVETLLRGIELRKWCVEMALKSGLGNVYLEAEKIHAFVTSDVKLPEQEGES